MNVSASAVCVRACTRTCALYVSMIEPSCQCVGLSFQYWLLCLCSVQAQVYARRQEEFAALRHAHERQLQMRKEQLRHERMMERRRAYLERCKQQVAAKVAEVEAAEAERAAARRKQVRACVHVQGER